MKIKKNMFIYLTALITIAGAVAAAHQSIKSQQDQDKLQRTLDSVQSQLSVANVGLANLNQELSDTKGQLDSTQGKLDKIIGQLDKNGIPYNSVTGDIDLSTSISKNVYGLDFSNTKDVTAFNIKVDNAINQPTTPPKTITDEQVLTAFKSFESELIMHLDGRRAMNSIKNNKVHLFFMVSTKGNIQMDEAKRMLEKHGNEVILGGPYVPENGEARDNYIIKPYKGDMMVVLTNPKRG